MMYPSRAALLPLLEAIVVVALFLQVPRVAAQRRQSGGGGGGGSGGGGRHQMGSRGGIAAAQNEELKFECANESALYEACQAGCGTTVRCRRDCAMVVVMGCSVCPVCSGGSGTESCMSECGRMLDAVCQIGAVDGGPSRKVTRKVCQSKGWRHLLSGSVASNSGGRFGSGIKNDMQPVTGMCSQLDYFSMYCQSFHSSQTEACSKAVIKAQRPRDIRSTLEVQHFLLAIATTNCYTVCEPPDCELDNEGEAECLKCMSKIALAREQNADQQPAERVDGLADKSRKFTSRFKDKEDITEAMHGFCECLSLDGAKCEEAMASLQGKVANPGTFNARESDCLVCCDDSLSSGFKWFTESLGGVGAMKDLLARNKTTTASNEAAEGGDDGRHIGNKLPKNKDLDCVLCPDFDCLKLEMANRFGKDASADQMRCLKGPSQ
eukprot:Filipodium_phascolosomae@DN404_c0_g1_i1.p1